LKDVFSIRILSCCNEVSIFIKAGSSQASNQSSEKAPAFRLKGKHRGRRTVWGIRHSPPRTQPDRVI